MALCCSLCISYLHWINVSHWWQVFKSMFINGFSKCLKIKSLTYWWSFRSCPGREKKRELERVWRAAELTPAAGKTRGWRRWKKKQKWWGAVGFLGGRHQALHSLMQRFLWLFKFMTLPKKISLDTAQSGDIVIFTINSHEIKHFFPLFSLACSTVKSRLIFLFLSDLLQPFGSPW